jgi:hypothetical protein
VGLDPRQDVGEKGRLQLDEAGGLDEAGASHGTLSRGGDRPCARGGLAATKPPRAPHPRRALSGPGLGPAHGMMPRICSEFEEGVG